LRTPTFVASLLLLATAPAVSRAEVLWRGDFETGNISQWNGRAQLVSADRLQVVSSPVRQGKYALKTTVKQGDDPINASGNRNELVRTNENATEGKEYYYAWSTQFANDFPSPNTWQLFVQWHHASNYGSPPVEFTAINEQIRLQIGGNPSRVVWSTKLTRGTWHDFVFHVKWSADPKVGFVELWHQGKRVLPKTYIATSFPGLANYMKAGLYRNETIAPTGVVWHDGFVQATRLEDVLPAAAPQPTTPTTPTSPAPPATPVVTAPAPATPDAAKPAPATPDTATPDTATPDTATPDTATPEEQTDALEGADEAALANAGCSSAAGAPWGAGLLALLGLAARRRRTARGG
jgi:MYXO-CTERM domain-containing protein